MKIIENYNYTCFKCLKHANVKKFEIPEVGDGSYFEGFSSEIHLCKDCITDEFLEWLKLDITTNDNKKHYLYERNILDFVRSFPIEGQEFFFNRFAYGYNVLYNSTEDWINQQKREKNITFVPQNDNCEDLTQKFTNCEEVFNVQISDKCVVSHCPFGEVGANDNINKNHAQCGYCKHYNNRITPIRTIPYSNVKEYSDSRLKQLLIKRTAEKKAREYETKHINSTQVNESKYMYGAIQTEPSFFDESSVVSENKAIITSCVIEVGGQKNE